jgi:hypothetical protein
VAKTYLATDEAGKGLYLYNPTPLGGHELFGEISRLPQGENGLFASHPLRGEDLGKGDLIMFYHQYSW